MFVGLHLGDTYELSLGEESWSGLEVDGTADDGRSGGAVLLRRQRQRTWGSHFPDITHH